MIEDSQGMLQWRHASTEYVEASQEGSGIANRLPGKCALKADDVGLLWFRTCGMHVQSVPVWHHLAPMRNCLEVASPHFVRTSEDMRLVVRRLLEHKTSLPTAAETR